MKSNKMHDHCHQALGQVWERRSGKEYCALSFCLSYILMLTLKLQKVARGNENQKTNETAINERE